MILALDVGWRKLGWAVLDMNDQPVDFGTIHNRKSSNSAAINRWINESYCLMLGLNAVIVKFPDVKIVVAEMPTMGSKSQNAAKSMASAVCIVIAFTHFKDLPLCVTSPRDGKKAATGSAEASKDEVMAAIRARWLDIRFPINKIDFEDIADALAAYLVMTGENNGS
jgi:Holliday junction resolvasome RuvABC endonuclease subunit